MHSVPQQVSSGAQPHGSGTQMPVRQTWPAGHAAPQAPQCRASWFVSTQPEPAQQLKPVAQARAPSHRHPPPTQALELPAGQALPHVPQFVGSVRVSTQRLLQQLPPSEHGPPVPHVAESGCPTSSSVIWVAAQPATSTTTAAHPAAPGGPPSTVRRIAYLPLQASDTGES